MEVFYNNITFPIKIEKRGVPKNMHHFMYSYSLAALIKRKDLFTMPSSYSYRKLHYSITINFCCPRYCKNNDKQSKLRKHNIFDGWSLTGNITNHLKIKVSVSMCVCVWVDVCQVFLYISTS